MTEVVKGDKKANWFKRHKVWTAIIIVIVLFSLIGATGDDDKKAATTKTDTTASAGDGTPTVAGEIKDTQPAPAPAPTPAQPSVPAEYKSALAKATSYSNIQHMSKRGLYDQLTSEYGEKFSAEAAQYGVDNVKADWNANALAKAKSYQSQQNMSPAAVRDQLVSEYGEKFTAAEADYAVAHLND